ncbi:MAG: hypothetical protein ACF8Q5_03785 [Phycisphaerales bacterium JB040]
MRLGNVLRAHHAFSALCCLPGAWCQSQALAQADPVQPGEALAVFERADAWIESGQVPPGAESSPVAGASVAIRLDGRLVGRGVSIGPEPDAGRVGRAVEEALRVARSAMEEAGPEPRMTLSLELATELVPIRLAEGEDLATRLSPGLDGLALRRGDQTAALFPSQMRERDTLPSAALGPLVALLGGTTAEKLTPAFELQEQGYALYRFRTTQLAEPVPGMSPRFLHRGGRVVGMHEITEAGLTEYAQGLINHLIGLEWNGREPVGLGGSLEPVTGRRDELHAPPVTQASVALALLRASRLAGLDPVTAEMARSSGEQLLRELADVADTEPEPWGSADSAAACVIALAEIPERRLESDPELSALRDRCLPAVRGAHSERTGFTQALGSGRTALVAYALVRDAIRFGGDRVGARAAVNAVYRDTPPGLLVSQMPWLGWASLELAGPDPVPSATLLREMRALVWQNRLRSVDVEYQDRDLAGGIVFTRGTTPLPTWHSLRPLAFIVSMLGREELTARTGTGEPGEWSTELVNAMESLRFVMQLSAGLEEGHMYAQPGLARYGVRASLWDQSMPTEASALALLTVTELLEAIRSRRGAQDAD